MTDLAHTPSPDEPVPAPETKVELVFEDPETTNNRIRMTDDEWQALMAPATLRPTQWARLRWFASDRGGERAAMRLRRRLQAGVFKDLPAGEWTFTSRRVPVKDGGGSKVFCMYTPPATPPRPTEEPIEVPPLTLSQP